MNEICIQILNAKVAEIKELTEPIENDRLSAAVQELEESVDLAHRILKGEEKS